MDQRTTAFRAFMAHGLANWRGVVNIPHDHHALAAHTLSYACIRAARDALTAAGVPRLRILRRWHRDWRP